MATEAPVADVPPQSRLAQPSTPGTDQLIQEGKKELLAAAAATSTVASEAPLPKVSSPVLQFPVLSPQDYPAALATHEAVINDEKLFMETFYKFHTSLKSKPTIPKMGGKDLDVHLLYKEVTARGGLQQVIRDRKWKEITGVFKFPRTTTSASYVLRKYYITLLHHYEQVYKTGASGPLIAPPATLPGSSPSVQPGDPALSEGGEPAVKKRVRKRRVNAPEVPEVDPSEAIGSTITGAIEGKLDFGYLVTMVVGGEKLKGVLYHVPPGSKVNQFASLPGLLNTITSGGIGIGETQTRRKRRRKEEMPKKDPNAPRPNRTGYNFFFAEQRQRLKALHPDKDREISRMIGEAWNGLTEEQKMPYQERGVKDKERFKREMRDYREMQKGGHFDSAADLGTGQAVTSPEDPSVPDQPLEHENSSAMGVGTPTGEPASEVPQKLTSTDTSGVSEQLYSEQKTTPLVSTHQEGAND